MTTKCWRDKGMVLFRLLLDMNVLYFKLVQLIDTDHTMIAKRVHAFPADGDKIRIKSKHYSLFLIYVKETIRIHLRLNTPPDPCSC